MKIILPAILAACVVALTASAQSNPPSGSATAGSKAAPTTRTVDSSHLVGNVSTNGPVWAKQGEDTSRTSPGQTLHVAVAPPDPMLDVQPPRPGPQYRWIPGSYLWRNNEWQWASGHWALPPHQGLAWYPAIYDTVTGTWTDGYWGPDPSPESPVTATDGAHLPATGPRSR